MPRHFIHYQPRRIVLRFPRNPQHPWFVEARNTAAGFARPAFHVTTRSDGAAAEIAAGDTIWLVSQLYSPWGCLPPALDARIDVKRVTPRKTGGWLYAAAASSRWFPLKDATPLLKSLRSQTKRGAVNRLWRNTKKPIGHALQSPRMLATSNAIEAWEQQLAAAPMHFISYRICDGTRMAFEQAAQLVARKHAVFWDRWCLPRRLAERRERVSDPALERHVMHELKRSAKVWGIQSATYGADDSYSARERDRALALGIFHAVEPDTP
jgi:hypothetical protein